MAQARQSTVTRNLLIVYCLSTVLISLAACYAFLSQHRASVYLLPNLVGPTAQSLTERHSFTVCPTDPAIDPYLCLYDGRMPAASVLIAVLRGIVGDDSLRVGLVKTVLMLTLVWLAGWTVFSSVNPRKAALVLAMLLVPFFATPLLADVVNLQVEEGYTYSALMLCVALLLFPAFWISESGRARWPWLITLALSVDLLYLAKSSMIAVVAVLVFWGLLQVKPGAQRLALCLLVLAAPVGWMVHAHTVSGRYAIGTSLDGINFHKGNNAKFLERFPPQPGRNLDEFDHELNVGHVFHNEWEYSDYHLQAGKQYMREHPSETVTGWWRKFYVLFFSMKKIGSTESQGAMRLAETLGLVILRVFLWVSFLLCCLWIVRPALPGDRLSGLLTLALFGAAAAPYLAGFGYTRHISVLLLPAALVLCRYAAPKARFF